MMRLFTSAAVFFVLVFPIITMGEVAKVPTDAPVQAQNSAYATGFLNVFTDLDAAVISVDGEAVSRESLVKYPLPLGEHLVQVTLEDRLVYQQVVTIQANRTATVVSDHFVDIITKTPSRGAIDREARRLRESRGNFALGAFGATALQSAASIKLWGEKHFGLQGYFLGAIPNTEHKGVIGLRGLFSPGDKVFGSDVTHAYMFFGGGRYANTVFLEGKNYIEMGLGVEAKLGELATNLFILNSIIQRAGKTEKQAKEQSVDLGAMLIVGVLNLFHTSAEITVLDRGAGFETGAALGFHVYF